MVQELVYFVMASFLVHEPVLPFRPYVASADCDKAVKRLLPPRWWREHGTLCSGVGVFQVLQGGAVGRIVVPYRELEEHHAQTEKNLR